MNNEVTDYVDEVPVPTPEEIEAMHRKFHAMCAASHARKTCKHTHGCVLELFQGFDGQPRAYALCVRCRAQMSAVREHPVWGTVYAFL